MKNYAHRLSSSALLVATILSARPCAAMPEEYEQEASFLASAPELNNMYGSIPNKKDETFVPLARVAWKNNSKYLLVRRAAGFRTRSYLVVKLSPSGVEIIDESFDNQFRHGDTPSLKGELPMAVAYEIYRQAFGPEENQARPVSHAHPSPNPPDPGPTPEPTPGPAARESSVDMASPAPSPETLP